MSEANSNTYTIMNNPLLQDTDVIEAAAGVIQDVLDTMDSYVPVEVNTFADWAYDAGDIVTIVKDGVDYVMPIFTNALNWNGGSDVTWGSSGNPEREIPDAPQRQSYGYGTAITQVETDLTETQKSFHTYMEQTDTYISLIATEEDIEEAQLVSKSLFQITSGQILSVVAQSGVMSSLQEFDRTKAYAVGDQVQYQGVWLEFVQPHAANTDLVWTEVKTVKTQETRITENSTGVESLVTKTGIGSLGQNETLYSKITQNADAISLVVTSTTGESGVTHTIDTASIILAINGGTGHSEAYIEAEKIILNGNVVSITGHFEAPTIAAPEIDCDYLYVNGGLNHEMGVNCEAHFYKTVFLAEDGGTVYVGDEDRINGAISSPNGAFGSLTIGIGEGQTAYTLDTLNVPSMVMNASVASNVLTLTKFDGTTVNFSKATSVSGDWSSGTYTANATQTNYNTTTRQYETTNVGSCSTSPTIQRGNWSSGVMTVSLVEGSGGATVSTGVTQTVSIPNVDTDPTDPDDDGYSYTYISGANKYSISYSIGGKSFTYSEIDAQDAYDAGAASGSVDSITFDAVDQGDPSYDVNDQYIYAYAKNGSTVVLSGSQLIHMTEGNWNSGGKAVNVRLNNSAGTLVTRLWAYSEDPSCGNIHSVGTTPGSWRTYCGSLSKSQIALLQVGTCWAFTVSVNGLSKEFYFILDS